MYGLPLTKFGHPLANPATQPKIWLQALCGGAIRSLHCRSDLAIPAQIWARDDEGNLDVGKGRVEGCCDRTTWIKVGGRDLYLCPWLRWTFLVCVCVYIYKTLGHVIPSAIFSHRISKEKNTSNLCVTLGEVQPGCWPHTAESAQPPVIKKVNIYLLSFPQLVTRFGQGAKVTAGGILTDILPLFILRICRFSKSTISRAISFLSPLPPLVFHWLWVFVDW